MSQNHNTRLLSTQDPYSTYDTSDQIIEISPQTWYPQNNGRLHALTAFYFAGILLNIGALIFPIIRYKNHPLFIDLHPIHFGWFYVYFGFWVQSLHVIFFAFALFDLMKRFSPSSDTIHGIKERMYDCMFSITFLSTVIYSVFILPHRISKIGEQSVTIEVWIQETCNNIIPFFFMIAETVVVHHRFAETLCRVVYEVLSPVLIYSMYVGFSYGVYYTKKNYQHWPYPYQNTLSDSGNIIFYSTGLWIIIFGYIIAKTLTRCLWNEKPVNTESDLAIEEDPSFTTYSMFESFVNENNTHNRFFQQQQLHQTANESSLMAQNRGYGHVNTAFDQYQPKGYY